MRFTGSARFTQGVADVDPVAVPATILPQHVCPMEDGVGPSTLLLMLAGAAAETVTVSIYALVEDYDEGADPATKFVGAGKRWFQIASGIVLTNNVLVEVTPSPIPTGGTIYLRRTADTITAGQTRPVIAQWV